MNPPTKQQLAEALREVIGECKFSSKLPDARGFGLISSARISGAKLLLAAHDAAPPDDSAELLDVAEKCAMHIRYAAPDMSGKDWALSIPGRKRERFATFREALRAAKEAK